MMQAPMMRGAAALARPQRPPPRQIMGGYAEGGYAQGPGDGTSDDILLPGPGNSPARLSDGEYVLTARAVSNIGDGSSDAGARKLDQAMAAFESGDIKRGAAALAMKPQRKPGGKFLGGLFGGDNEATTTTKVEYPPEVLERLGIGNQAGKNLLGLPYSPYPGARLAPFSPDTLLAMQYARQQAQRAQADLNRMRGIAMLSSMPVTGRDIDRYMNPYIDRVASRTADMANRFLTEKALPAINETFVGAGQDNSSREGTFKERAARDITENLQSQMSALYGQGFQNALNAAQSDRQQMLRGAASLMPMYTGQIDALNRAGMMQQGQLQRELDIPYQMFLEARDYPYRVTSGAIPMLNLGGNPQLSTTSTQTTPGPSPLESILGLATTAAGIYSGFGGGSLFGAGGGGASGLLGAGGGASLWANPDLLFNNPAQMLGGGMIPFAKGGRVGRRRPRKRGAAALRRRGQIALIQSASQHV